MPGRVRPIVFGALLDDARTQYPSRNQLLLSIAEKHPVVFLQAPANPRAVNMRRPVVVQAGENVYIARDALTLRSHRVGRSLAAVTRFLDARFLAAELRELGFGEPVMWLYGLDAALAKGIPNGRLIYDCIDPNFIPASHLAYRKLESRIATRSAVVFATAAQLFERMARLSSRAFLLPNAAPNAILTPPDRQHSATSRPTAGYLGTIDWRFSSEYVVHAARALPDIQFVIAGRVNPDQRRKELELRSLPNVKVLGAVSNAEGEELLKSWHAGLIPFTPGAIGDSINPVKMFLYLAAGLPVVSSDIRECRENPFVTTASLSEFGSAVRSAIELDTYESALQRVDYAMANTWRHRAEAALSVLRQHAVI
jgi:glycosyltransferase involved in cell wall biosynthesis